MKLEVNIPLRWGYTQAANKEPITANPFDKDEDFWSHQQWQEGWELYFTDKDADKSPTLNEAVKVVGVGILEDRKKLKASAAG